MNKENGHSALIAITNKGGRPTKYEPEAVDRLLAALADGLTQKQAFIASGASTRSWPRGGGQAARQAGNRTGWAGYGPSWQAAQGSPGQGAGLGRLGRLFRGCL